MSSCEVFRKYVYAIHLLIGDEGNYNMKGLWLMRGTEKLPNLDMNPDTEYYFYKKLNLKDENDKSLIK